MCSDCGTRVRCQNHRMIANETGLTARVFAVAILLACSVIWISAPFHFIGVLLLDLADDGCAVIAMPFCDSTSFIGIFLVLRTPMVTTSTPLWFVIAPRLYSCDLRVCIGYALAGIDARQLITCRLVISSKPHSLSLSHPPKSQGAQV